MREANKIILVTIISFLLANQFILYFEIVENPQIKSITFDQHKSQKPISTLRLNDFFKLTIVRDGHERIVDLELFFNQNPSLLLYIFFLTFFMSISLGLIFPLIRRAKDQLRFLKTREVFFYAAFSIMITLGVFVICNVIPYAWSPQEIIGELGIFFQHPVSVMMTLLTPLLMVTAICIFGMFSISKAIDSFDITPENPDAAIVSYLDFKKRLEEYVLIFGLLTASGSIIISSTLANSINGYFINNSIVHFVPKEFIYLYGLAFTACLIIMYIPTYLKLRKKGELILSTVNPLNTQDLDVWVKSNGSYLELLEIKGKVWDSVGASLRVFIPFITSIITTLIS